VYASVVGAERSWTVRRGKPGDASIVVVGSKKRRLSAVADELNTAGYYVIGCKPTAFEEVLVMATFDVAVLLLDLSEHERELVASAWNHRADRSRGRLLIEPASKLPVAELVDVALLGARRSAP